MAVPRLNAEQRLSWSADLPFGPAALPELMERLHFAVVERQTLGLVRPRRSATAVSLDLLGRWPLMRFERDGDEVGPGRALRRYRLPPSLVTRRAPVVGRFELGVERRRGRTRAWVRAADFPALLLSCPPPAPTIYAAFHAHVSHGYLRVLRSRLALSR
ncbi:MAG TPA: hypothetical protein VGL23_07770 [Chloroflexota bacterium]